MLLTKAERERFCEYLRCQISSSEAIIGQFEKLPAGSELAKRERTRYLAWKIVLQDLESVEDETISGIR